MSSLPAPRLRRTDQNVQLSYETAHRITSAARYPLSSPNGSSIFIYGNTSGVRIIWRGGRPFKPSAPAKAPEIARSNGTSNDAVMIIDSDDEGAISSTAVVEDKPDFEDEEDELDVLAPYPPILQHLDLALGTSVISISVPSTAITDTSSGGVPDIVENQIVFAATCADSTVRLITLPLTPPSPATKSRADVRASSTAGNAGNGKWGESVTVLSGHPVVADGVSITFTTTRRKGTDNALIERSRSKSRPRTTSDEWHILVASHSKAVSGLLLLHHLPIASSQKNGAVAYSFPSTATLPIQTQYLSSPAVSISFNTSVFSSHRSTYLLVADKSGACKIYDPQPASFRDDSPASFATQGGLWLLTLHPGFQSTKSDINGIVNTSSLRNSGRKAIVDAKWVVDGRAIMVLLADGEWGIWDIEGAQPGSSRSLLSGSNLKGGAITRFSISGWIDGAPIKSSSRNASQQVAGKFAPMTPGARRTIEPTLFSDKSPHGTVHGAISVARLQSAYATNAIEESIAIWLEDSFVIIPNLAAYWEAQRSRSGGQGSLFNGNNKPGSKLIKIENINLRGEQCCGIDQALRSQHAIKSSFPTDLLVVGEHRFLIVSDGIPTKSEARKAGGALVLAGSQAAGSDTGLLGVDDIDQALELMDQDSPIRRGRKGVGFLV